MASRDQAGQEFSEPFGDEVSWTDLYEMIECAGCESVSLRNTYWWSEEPADKTVTYFPPTVSRPTPLWIHKTPPQIAAVMQEVYVALHSDSRTLALMGLRTLVDLLLVDKVGDAGFFKTKLQQLQAQGFVGEHHVKILDAALEAGNAAAHRGHTPSPKDLAQVMDIVENLLQSVYVLSKAAAALKATTPPRSSTKNA